jgi:hypothetical protein
MLSRLYAAVVHDTKQAQPESGWPLRDLWLTVTAVTMRRVESARGLLLWQAVGF